jgi:hypothetical protein
VLEALLDAAAAVLAADSLEDTLRRIALQLGALVAYDDLALYELVDAGRTLSPAFAAGRWADEVMAESFSHDEGITGEVVRDRRTRNVRRADLDPQGEVVAGTVDEAEALICVPLLGRTSGDRGAECLSARRAGSVLGDRGGGRRAVRDDGGTRVRLGAPSGRPCAVRPGPTGSPGC